VLAACLPPKSPPANNTTATTRAAGAITPPSSTTPTTTTAPPTGGGWAQNGSLGSCHVFPADNAWNRDVSGLPVDPNSTNYISAITALGGNQKLHADFGGDGAYGIPYITVPGTQPLVPVDFDAYGDESDPGPFPVPAKAPIEGGNRSDGDRHVLVVDRAGCKLYELYRAFYIAKPRPHWNADSGTAWDLRSVARRPDGWTSADAAGLPIFPGLVRYDEVASGDLDHAIRVTVESSRDAWVHPASHCAGDTSDPNAPPMGLRLRLKAGYSLGRFSGGAAAIARAMKRYGLIVADNGSNWFFSGTSDRRWSDENLNQLKSIPGRAFEAVKSAAPIRPC